MAVHLPGDRAVIGWGAFDADFIAILEPRARSRLTEYERVIVHLVDEHVPIQLEPGAIRAGRPEVLSPSPAMLDRFQNRMAEGAGHVTVKGAYGGLRLVAQKVGGGLLIIHRLVGHAPAVQKKIVLM